MIEIKIDDAGVRDLLTALEARMRDMRPAMRAISGIMHYAVEANFGEEGRPKWPKLADSTKKQKAKIGKERMLQVSGLMAAANTPGHDNTSAWVSNNREYAPYQQFGTRPYIIRPKDKPYLRFQIGNRWITKKEVHHPGLPPRPETPPLARGRPSPENQHKRIPGKHPHSRGEDE